MQRFVAAKQELITRSTAKQVFGLIAAEMRLVEEEFEQQASSNIQVINYLGDYLRASGGKRLRPALLILTNRASGGEADDNVIKLATVMEMLHTATLVHDDIIDNADVRRNRPSINARFGNQSAVLMGDWLYMSAFETALGERSLEILDILTSLTRKMTEGEIIQMTMIARLDISVEDYFNILRRKTAYLFSACCEIGAIQAKADEATKLAMRNFGLDLGIAFQLADDLLDLMGDSESLGKDAGADLLEGKLTLPLIKLVEAEPEMRGVFERIMLDGNYNSFSRDKIRLRLETARIIDDMKTEAQTFLRRAKKSLDVLPETQYRSALEAILNFIIERNA